MRTHTSLLSLATLGVLITACAVPNSPMGVIGAVRDVQAARTAVAIYGDFYEARRQPIPLRGTYQLTWSMPGEDDVTYYVRTLWNANVPIMIADHKQRDGIWRGIENYDLSTAYMVNAMGADSYEGVPASLDSAAIGSVSIGGFLVITDAAGTDEQGRTRYIGGWMVTPADTTPGTPGHRVVSAMRAAAAAQDQAERRMSRSERAQQPQDAFEAMNTLFLAGSDGSVSATTVTTVGGREFYRLSAVRLDTLAYRIGEEALKNPFTGR